ncbi:MAG: hypothetical protein AAFO02_01460 [Bacteroidota bacterium]
MTTEERIQGIIRAYKEQVITAEEGMDEIETILIPCEPLSAQSP